ncbi:MAG: YlbF family regulator [Bacillota bacterium]|nr:YlbF family regulator [Bacillota bacterium]
MSVSNVYDQAHLLARSIKASPEYADFRLASSRLEGEKSSLAVFRDFRRRQFELQSRLFRGQEVDEAEQERFAKLSDIVSSHPVISAFLQAEFTLSRLLGDIQKIIAEAVDIELSWSEAENKEVATAATDAAAEGAAAEAASEVASQADETGRSGPEAPRG